VKIDWRGRLLLLTKRAKAIENVQITSYTEARAKRAFTQCAMTDALNGASQRWNSR
jgi:hypothetical protein